jgi:hypothetical protein
MANIDLLPLTKAPLLRQLFCFISLLILAFLWVKKWIQATARFLVGKASHFFPILIQINGLGAFTGIKEPFQRQKAGNRKNTVYPLGKNLIFAPAVSVFSYSFLQYIPYQSQHLLTPGTAKTANS